MPTRELLRSAAVSDVMNSRRSLDDLVGASEQRRWNLKAKGFGGLDIDHELILGWCLHRQVGGVLALEDAVDVAGRALGMDRRCQVRKRSGRRSRTKKR